MNTEHSQMTSAMISEQTHDPCADIDLIKIEEAGNQIMEHIVNVDIVNY